MIYHMPGVICAGSAQCKAVMIKPPTALNDYISHACSKRWPIRRGRRDKYIWGEGWGEELPFKRMQISTQDSLFVC